MKRIIALDLGSTTGIAWGTGPRPQDHEFVDFVGKGSFSPFSFYKFHIHLEILIKDSFRLSKETIQLVIEKPNARMPGYAGVRVHFGMLGVALALEGKYNSQVISHVVPALTVKKFWTGSGRAKKPDMIAQAQREGYDVTDDNEADAIALYHYSQEVLFKGVK